MALSHIWESDEALSRGTSSLASTAIPINSVTGPTQAHCTVDAIVFDFRLHITVGSSNPPPERWITAVNPMVTIQHEPGSHSTDYAPFSDQPGLMGVIMLQQVVRVGITDLHSYVVTYRCRELFRTNKQRVGSGSAFNPPHVTAALWSFDGYNDLTGSPGYSINIDWFGMLRANFAYA